MVGCSLLWLAWKLKNLRSALKGWTKSIFGDVNQNLQILEDDILKFEHYLQLQRLESVNISSGANSVLLRPCFRKKYFECRNCERSDLNGKGIKTQKLFMLQLA